MTNLINAVPEHPDWKPWWIRYAEFGGRCVLLGDHFAVPHPIQEGWKQYEVIVGTPKSAPRPLQLPGRVRPRHRQTLDRQPSLSRQRSPRSPRRVLRSRARTDRSYSMTNLSHAVPDEDVSAWADEGECRNCGWGEVKHTSATIRGRIRLLCIEPDDCDMYAPETDEDRKDAADEARADQMRDGG